MFLLVSWGMAAARVVHSPEAVQGRAAAEDVCEPQPAQPSRFELVAGPEGIRRAPPVRSREPPGGPSARPSLHVYPNFELGAEPEGIRCAPPLRIVYL